MMQLDQHIFGQVGGGPAKTQNPSKGDYPLETTEGGVSQDIEGR